MKMIYKINVPASFTIEASVVMPMVLISLVGMIIFGSKLHDIVTANITANEMSELYGHLPEGSDISIIDDYGNERMKSIFSGRAYSMDIKEYKDGSRTEISGKEGIRVFEDAGFDIKGIMRKLTLLEEAVADE